MTFLAKWRARRAERQQAKLDGRIFVDHNAKYSRQHMIRGAKIGPPNREIEREVAEWLYPKELK